jgi:hypothetical protein
VERVEAFHQVEVVVQAMDEVKRRAEARRAGLTNSVSAVLIAAKWGSMPLAGSTPAAAMTWMNSGATSRIRPWSGGCRPVR